MKLRTLPWTLAISIASFSCSGHGGQIDAYVQYRVEFPEDVADTLEFPALLTLSLGHKGKEEVTGSASEQRAVVLCRPLEPFVYNDYVRLLTTCRRGDFYAHASVREIQLENPDACGEADTDGVLVLSREDYLENSHVFAEDSTVAFYNRDCGPQNAKVELTLKKLN